MPNFIALRSACVWARGPYRQNALSDRSPRAAGLRRGAMASGVGLHISQALKGRAKKALEFTQLIKAIGAAAAAHALRRFAARAQATRPDAGSSSPPGVPARRRVQEQG